MAEQTFCLMLSENLHSNSRRNVSGTIVQMSLQMFLCKTQETLPLIQKNLALVFELSGRHLYIRSLA